MERIVHQKDDLVNILASFRGKHILPKAVEGHSYLVISHYTNSFNMIKYIVLDSEGIEHVADDSVEKVLDFSLEGSEVWKRAKRLWMDRTYVPVFGVHTYDYVGMPFVSSRDGNSRLMKPLFNANKSTPGVWIHKSRVHDDDVEMFMYPSFPQDIEKTGELSEAITFRVPVWFAEKTGFIGRG